MSLEHIARDLRPLARTLGELFHDPKNARRHNDRNLQATRESLSRFGQQKNIVARWSPEGPPFMVVAGNGTLACAHALGWTHLAVSVQEMDDKTALAYAIADNRTAELAEWDAQALDVAMRELEAQDADLAAALEFTPEERAFLLDEQAPEPPAGADPGPQEPPPVPQSRTGEIYLLGPHRLMCGDSTSAEDMARLMNGERAVLMPTDPPYLVDYDKTWDDYNEATAGLFRAFLGVTLEHLTPDAPIYQWHASRRQKLVEEAWEAHGILVHQTIVWVKSQGVLTRSHFLWKHEPCFYGWRQGHQPDKDRRPPHNQTTVWVIEHKGQLEGIHPTQKPIEVALWPIEWHTRAGELVLEPFGGSGTCIMAAARTGRRCNTMEMSPAFCDAIRRRWGAWARSAGVDPGPGAL